MKKLFVKIYNFLYYWLKRKKHSFNNKLQDFLNQLSFLKNDKQKGWEAVLNLYSGDHLTVLETGRSRNPKWRKSDGNSTYFFSKHKKIKSLISIDNDSENYSNFSGSEDFCRNFLSTKQLKKIKFINGDSRDEIKKLANDTVIDLAFLDSANQGELIFEEYQSVEKYLNTDFAIVLIDDVTPPGKKGDKIIPFLENKGFQKHFISAPPNDCCYFIINK